MLFAKVFLKFTLITVLLIFLFVEESDAVSVTIFNYPSIITDDSFTITASVSGATSGTNYLKIDLFKDGLVSYFGETFNNSDWYGGPTYSQYLPITIQTGTVWGGIIQGRVGSPTSSQYDGTGTYKMRVRRYTSGGGYIFFETKKKAGGVLINFSIPTTKPTPTPSSKPSLNPLSKPPPPPTPPPNTNTTPPPNIS